jgi:hypothetical protein
LLALVCAVLLKFEAILLGRDRLLQRCLTLLQRGVFLGLSARHTFLLSELLQRLIACQDRALLLQDGFVVRHAALVHGQLLAHFEQFVLHLLQTTGHIVRTLALQFQGILTLAQLLRDCWALCGSLAAAPGHLGERSRRQPGLLSASRLATSSQRDAGWKF